MLAGRGGLIAMLQFVVSRTHARGSYAMLRDADARGVNRSGAGHNAGRAKFRCDDRRADSSLVGFDPVTLERNAGRARQFAANCGCAVAPLLPPNLIPVPKLR